MKKAIKFVGNHWKRIIVSILLVALCAHWGWFGSLGVIPGCLAIYIWTA